MSPLDMSTNPENNEEFHTPLQTSSRYGGHDDIHSIMDDEVSLWNWQKGIYKGYISQVVT
jgi:hypothetical protein